MSNYKNFKISLEASLKNANRNSQDIELIAVSKKKSAIDIQKVIDEGHLSFGENQIQEIESKWPELKNLNSNITLHFLSLKHHKISNENILYKLIQGMNHKNQGFY